MKRFIATMLSFVMLLSVVVSSASAIETGDGYIDENSTINLRESSLLISIGDESAVSSDPADLIQLDTEEDLETITLGTESIKYYKDAFTSPSEQIKYRITLNFSDVTEYCLGFIRTGRSGFTVTAYDEDDKYVTGGYCSGPGPTQNVGGQIFLRSPSVATTEYTFTILVSAPSYEYVEGSTSFQLAIGPSSNKEYFFEGPENCMYLPYYHRYRNSKQDLASYKQTNSIGAEGFYYKIDATGTETVTLATDQNQYYFKVLEADTNKQIFDSVEIGSWKIDGLDGYYSVKTIDFTPGGSYYVVVYANGTPYHDGAYTITVGDHRTHLAKITTKVPAQIVTANKSYDTTFVVPAPAKGGQAYAWKMRYWPSAAGGSTNFSTLSPGSTRWSSFGLTGLDFGFENEYSPLVNAIGKWTFRFKASSSGSYKGGTLDFYYYYDIT